MKQSISYITKAEIETINDKTTLKLKTVIKLSKQREHKIHIMQATHVQCKKKLGPTATVPFCNFDKTMAAIG